MPVTVRPSNQIQEIVVRAKYGTAISVYQQILGFLLFISENLSQDLEFRALIHQFS